MDTIASMLKAYLDNDGELSGCLGKFHGNDFNLILSVITGESKSFVIFNNSGGNPFTVWTFEDMKKRGDGKYTIKDFKNFVEKKLSGYTYAYSINGEETILRTLKVSK